MADLKDAIRTKKANDLKTVDADRLDLYQAKRDHLRLKSRDPDVVALKKGEIPEGIAVLLTEEMDETLRVGDKKHYGESFVLSEGRYPCTGGPKEYFLREQPASPTRLNSAVFWCFAKGVLSDATSHARILLFAAYGFDLQCWCVVWTKWVYVGCATHAEEKSSIWGIELVRGADRLEVHIGRFATGGRYSMLELTNFCLIGFRGKDCSRLGPLREALGRELRCKIGECGCVHFADGRHQVSKSCLILPNAVTAKMDISDAFDEISNWEEQLLIEGEELGMERGRELGIEEGRELGMMKGAEIGSEVGFYQGCFAVWSQMLQNEEMRQKINERASKSIVSLGALLEAFELKHIRAKFKVITALLGLRSSLVYSQEDVDAHKNMSF
ncbi:hypothetical protein FI667_g6147, partial [Globisporangium splendens]